MVAAGRDPREPAEREPPALARMEEPEANGSSGAQDFIAAENLRDRRHGEGCRLALGEERRDGAACPGHCITRDSAWWAWGLL